MPYTREFFELQVRFARAMTAKFRLDPRQALSEYTTFSRTVAPGSLWEEYLRGARKAGDLTEWTYSFYLSDLPRRPPEPMPEGTSYRECPLFGCFYYKQKNGGVIRPHFVSNDAPGMSPLSRGRMEARRADLTRMYTHVRRHVPTAETVMGSSWLLNLDAYRRLLPPEYVATAVESPFDHFNGMSRWGQFYDRYWNVKDDAARELFSRLERLQKRADLRTCFPLPVLQVRAPIGLFYDFHGVKAVTRDP